ncbi:hypothetical protein BH23ACT4_BH23ACT4_01670 [soil metagenome]
MAHRQVNAEHGGREAEARLIWFGADKPSRVVYVAECAEEVGSHPLSQTESTRTWGSPLANAGWMVEESFRRRGLGRAFAIYVFEEARRLGYRGMQFNAVVSTNEAAVVQ